MSSDTYDALMGALQDIPPLPQAACRGKSRLFEDPGRVQEATEICLYACPTATFDACDTYWLSLKPALRPTNCVVAGEWRPEPKPRPARKRPAA